MRPSESFPSLIMLWQTGAPWISCSFWCKLLTVDAEGRVRSR
jgi:hypothetical protein